MRETEEEYPELSDADFERYLEKWSVLTVDNTKLGQSWIVRLIGSKPEIPEIQQLNTAVAVQWEFQSDSGMPPSEVNQEHLEFERAIDPILCFNGHSELVQGPNWLRCEGVAFLHGQLSAIYVHAQPASEGPP